MTDYILREIETDKLVDEVARQRERVTVLPDTADEIPLDQALETVRHVAAAYEAQG